MPRTLGVVGKPNVGKSTFFSAATLLNVPIANYPFTTIKPNVGIAYLRKPCVCSKFKVKDNPNNSICIDGSRLIPVQVVDCAGLVPDAWKGRGLGNQFLSQIAQADALIHVVDASGSTDSEGKPCTPGSHDPTEDLKFLEHELDMWLLQILRKEWDKLVRRVETSGQDLSTILLKSFSGLGINKTHLIKVRDDTQLNFDRPTAWSEDDLLTFTSNLRRVSKPMLIAANKIDVPEPGENLKKIAALGYRVIPCSAEAELVLRKASEKSLVTYVPGDTKFQLIVGSKLTAEQTSALDMIKEKVLERYGSTGVQEALNVTFFSLLKMIAVYPVEDAEKLTDHSGRVLPDVYLVPEGTSAKELATLIHTDLGRGFLYAIDASTRRRLAADYPLKDDEVVSIVSATSHA